MDCADAVDGPGMTTRSTTAAALSGLRMIAWLAAAGLLYLLASRLTSAVTDQARAAL